MKKHKIYFILHLENYRIGFITPKSWTRKPYYKGLKKWFFSYFTFWPDTRTEIFQLYFCGLGFGYKKKIR